MPWLLVMVLMTLAGQGYAQKARLLAVDRSDYKAALEKEERVRFFEAQALYQGVAFSEMARLRADSEYDFELGRDALDRAIHCAQMCGDRKGAAVLLDSLIGSGREEFAHREARFELALQLGEWDLASDLLASSSNSGQEGEVWRDLAQRQLEQLEDLLAREKRGQVELIRPSSPHAEFGAVPLGEGLVFVTSGIGSGFGAGVDGWTGQSYNQLGYIAHMDLVEKAVLFEDKLSRKDVLAGALKGRFHSGPVALDRDESLMIVTQSAPADGPSGEEGPRNQGLRLHFFQKQEESDWSDAVDVTEEWFPHNDPMHNTCHATQDTLGNLVFASDRPGGLGKMDLWMSTWNGEQFEAPIHLGPQINTEGNEVFPFVDANNVLYCSSDGRLGFGGLDVHRQKLDGTGLELLPRPVNSSSDDFAIFLREDGTGFVSSDREGGLDRVYALDLRETVTEFEIRYEECDGQPFANAEVVVDNQTTGETETATTDERGVIVLRPVRGDSIEVRFDGDDIHRPLPVLALASPSQAKTTMVQQVESIPANPTLTVLASADQTWSAPPTVDVVYEGGQIRRFETDEEGHLEWSSTDLTGAQSFDVAANGFDLQSVALPAEVNCKGGEAFRVELEPSFDLSLVFYDFDRATLRAESRAVLDEVVAYMKSAPHVVMELAAHTDSQGPAEYNMKLSQRRAQSCVDYILAQGIEAHRLQPKGYGEGRLTNGCSDHVPCSASQHQANRRTVLNPVSR